MYNRYNPDDNLPLDALESISFAPKLPVEFETGHHVNRSRRPLRPHPPPLQTPPPPPLPPPPPPPPNMPYIASMKIHCMLPALDLKDQGKPVKYF